MATEFVMWDTATLHDRKVRDLIRDKGYAGLGMYFAIVTIIRGDDKPVFDLNDKSDKNRLLDELHVTEKVLMKWLNTLSEYNLFDASLLESGQVTSERMLREHKKQFKKSEQCSDAGRKSGEARRKKAEAAKQD